MVGIGIDIGSTATKLAVLDEDGELAYVDVMPTGFSSVEAAERAREALLAEGFDVGAPEVRTVATGYGRVSVPYAQKIVTEITCHGLGAARLFGADGVVIDVGGQDTKVIRLKGGRVVKFIMNDKCAAGTGRFLEVMSDKLGVSQQELSRLASDGEGLGIKISSMCTVFAESEVISLVGRGDGKLGAGFQPGHAARHRVCALFRDMFGGKQRFRLLFERAVGFAAGQKRLLERLVARLTEHVVNRAERHLHCKRRAWPSFVHQSDEPEQHPAE